MDTMFSVAEMISQRHDAPAPIKIEPRVPSAFHTPTRNTEEPYVHVTTNLPPMDPELDSRVPGELDESREEERSDEGDSSNHSTPGHKQDSTSPQSNSEYIISYLFNKS